MPLILKNRFDRAVAQLAHSRAMRSTNEIVEQLQERNKMLQEQLKAEREQRAFDCRYYEEQIKMLLRDLAELKYELVKRDRERAFAAAPSPSQAMH